MDLPPDLANGMTSLIVENFPQKATEMKVSYLAGSSKPRVVKLSVKPDGEEDYRIGGVILIRIQRGISNPGKAGQ
jgi:hypothetical protein